MFAAASTVAVCGDRCGSAMRKFCVATQNERLVAPTTIASRTAAEARRGELIRSSLHVELHALGERQLAARVDVSGLSAPVGRPGVAAGLAPAAGLLLAADRAADLRARRPDVDVGDAAVAAAVREPALGRVQVGGEDRRGEPLRHAVVE